MASFISNVLQMAHAAPVCGIPHAVEGTGSNQWMIKQKTENTAEDQSRNTR